MGLPKTKPLTEAEYLEFERAATERHLYVDGEIFAMASERPNHGYASANLAVSIGSQLRGKRCAAFIKDMKVRSGPLAAASKSYAGMYSYPDVVVHCGEAKFLDANGDVLVNPVAVFEVLSPSTEAFDRGDKFNRYQSHNPTLTDYVLVSQDEPLIEHFHRMDDGSWSYRRAIGLKAKLAVPSIGVTLELAEVYERVRFE